MSVPTNEVLAAEPDAPIVDRDAAAAYVASVCFKHGPPRLIGVELEWLVRDTTDPTRPVDPAALVRALGPYTPPTLRPPSPAGPAADAPAPTLLPRGGTVTVEPGGQVEVASPPLPTLTALVEAVDTDAAEIARRLADEHLTLVRRASDPLRRPRRILDVPRYAAMEAAFDRIGPHGRTMMCSTAAVQVCLDAGDGHAVAARWDALHELGPVLTATFANSPAVHGRRTGWKSSRMASWLTLDPERTSPPSGHGPDPAAGYARRALDTRLLCVRRPGAGGGTSWSAPDGLTFGDWIDGRGDLEHRPTRADLDYHLTTLFPPVRPQGHLEVRYLDQQTGPDWAVPAAVVTALLSDDAVLDRARAAAAPVAGRWLAAARDGLADPALQRAAAAILPLAHEALGALLAAEEPGERATALRERVAAVVEQRVLRGRCPADEAVDEPGESDLGPPDGDPFAPPRPPDPATTSEPAGTSDPDTTEGAR